VVVNAVRIVVIVNAEFTAAVTAAGPAAVTAAGRASVTAEGGNHDVMSACNNRNIAQII